MVAEGNAAPYPRDLRQLLERYETIDKPQRLSTANASAILGRDKPGPFLDSDECEKVLFPGIQAGNIEAPGKHRIDEGHLINLMDRDFPAKQRDIHHHAPAARPNSGASP